MTGISLHSKSPLDISVKGAMIRDLLNMAGYMLPDKDDVVANSTPSADPRYMYCRYQPSGSQVLHRRPIGPAG